MSQTTSNKQPVLLKAHWGSKRNSGNKIVTAKYGDTVRFRVWTKYCIRATSDLFVVIKDVKSGKVIAPIDDEEKIKLKYWRNGIFWGEIKIEPEWYARSGENEGANFYFCISGTVVKKGKKYEFHEEVLIKRKDYLKVPTPVFIDGRWLNLRNYKEPYTIENPYVHRNNGLSLALDRVAYGIKAMIRFKVKDISSSVSELKVKIMENDTFIDDVITEVVAKWRKTEKSYSIYEGEVLLTKKDFFERTGKETLSDFYFIPQIDCKDVVISKKLPELTENYLSVKAPGETINEQVMEIGKVYLLDHDSYNRKYLFRDSNNEAGFGVPESIYYKGKRIATIPKNVTTYCCGFTFWVVMRVLQSNKVIEKMEKEIRDKLINALEKGTAETDHINAVNRKVEVLKRKTNGNIDKRKVIIEYATKTALEDIRDKIKDDLYDYFYNIGLGQVDGLKACAAGIPNFGIGREIINKDDWQTGDFVQLNKSYPSGHSVIFIEWFEEDGYTKMKFLGTQGKVGVNYSEATDGIEVKKATFSNNRRHYKLNRTYAARLEIEEVTE